jgi:hypothetical protein
MLKSILSIYKYYEWMKPNTYYYYDGITVLNISLIIFLLDIFLIGLFLKNNIFENRLYYIKNNRLKKYNSDKINNIELKDNIFYKKIIKDIEYNDLNYKFNLNILKENIYNIDGSIPLSLVLNLYKNININSNSMLHIKYFKNDTKIFKILSTTKFEDILT